VALKLPRLLTGRAALAERLAREREILAALNHPHIARLYDAGLTAEGQPYLALEHVEGERIDAYCARKGLDVAARLRLFVQVARAVAHAHAQLVVHRDLKPANILVTEAGEVKLLDFGIAKLLEDGRAQETELTQLAGRALTPDYAAPEQILGQPIGTAADAYSLGVVLYELLTGTKPYKLRRDSRAALEEAIASVEPLRASAAVSEAKLRKQLRGDLDTIVLKALKKRPAERYGTVEAFAEDVERYLAQQPVRARPDRWPYRAGKFVLRHRYAVAAAAAVMTTAIAGAAASLWQAREAERQREVALRERSNADEVKNFVLAMLRDAGPQNAAGKVISPAEMLARARTRIDRIDPQRVAVRVELLGTVGDSLLMLEDAKAAESVLLQAIAEAQAGLDASDKRVLWAKSMLSQAYRRQNRYAEMRAVLEDILPRLRAREAELPNQLLAALVNLVNLNCGEYRMDECERAVDEGLGVLERRFGGRHVNGLLLLARRAETLAWRGQPARGLEVAEQAVKLALEMHGGNARHTMVLYARMARVHALAGLGRLDEALRESDALLADTEAAFAGRTRVYALRLLAFAPILLEAGAVERALAFTEEGLAILSNYQEGDALSLGLAYAARGRALLAALRDAEAVAALAEAQRILRGALAADNEMLRAVAHDHALALAYAGRITAAVGLLAHTPAPSPAFSPQLALQAWLDRAVVFRLAARPADAASCVRAAEAIAKGNDFVPAALRQRLAWAVRAGSGALPTGRRDRGSAGSG
jgi:serine/threonine-protein kinase